MHLFTHLLASWQLSTFVSNNRQERQILTASGMIPDVDVIPAMVAYVFSKEKAVDVYGKYHHILTHNITAAVIVAILVFLILKGRSRYGLYALIIFHIHLFLDLIGSAGPGGSRWDISYFIPFNKTAVAFLRQWPINAWPNILITIILLLAAIIHAAQKGYSPVELLSIRMDQKVIKAIQNRIKKRW